MERKESEDIEDEYDYVDNEVGKLDSFKDIPSAKKEKGVEEEVDSKRTKKKMDLDAGPSNADPTNPGPVAPQPLKLPRRQSSGNSLEGSS
jgi:hypothetical protein